MSCQEFFILRLDSTVKGNNLVLKLLIPPIHSKPWFHWATYAMKRVGRKKAE